MNFSIDWGAVIVCAVGAFGSVIFLKNDMKWVKDTLTRLEKDIGGAHKRIDALLARDRNSRYTDEPAE